MDAHFTKVKNVTNMLEKIDLMLPKDIIIYYTIQNLPKEYEIFKKIHLGGDQLSRYEAMESKLLNGDGYES
jgi:hypothetical protein